MATPMIVAMMITTPTLTVMTMGVMSKAPLALVPISLSVVGDSVVDISSLVPVVVAVLGGVVVVVVMGSVVVMRSVVVTSPGQCSTGRLELTAHTLDTVRGRSATGMVTPPDTQSWRVAISSEALVLRVPCSWAW